LIKDPVTLNPSFPRAYSALIGQMAKYVVISLPIWKPNGHYFFEDFIKDETMEYKEVTMTFSHLKIRGYTH